MSFLFDTNVVSELTRRQPNHGVARWTAGIALHRLSAITIDELWFGISRKPTAALVEWITQYAATHEVLPITADIARRAGVLRGEFSRRGIVREQGDMLIAATAQAHGLTLVTRNTRYFEGCGIALLNPFTE